MKQATKKILIGVMIVTSLLAVILVSSLVWGQTIRMSQANRNLAAGRTDAARKIYEDLAVDLPESPYVLHNLGLAAYQQGQYQQAVTNLQKALEQLKKLPNSKTKLALTAKCHYHLGNALFKLAETGKNGSSPNQQQPVDLYSGALANFRSAIEADPTDRDAKYNYELTQLRLDEAQQQKQSDQNRDDQDKNKKKDGQQQKQSNRSGQDQQDQQKQAGQNPNQTQDQKNNGSNGQNQKDQPQGQNNQKQDHQGQTGSQKRGMTKQEAQALLNSAENGDQYMAPIIRDDSSVQKDW